MATMDESGLCSRQEYDAVYESRMLESAVELGQLAMMHMEACGDKSLAVKQAVRIRRIGGVVVGTAGVATDIDMLDMDMQVQETFQGRMLDGVWNLVKDGKIAMVVANVADGRQYHIGNGCLTEYGDGIDDELEVMMARDLVATRSQY